MPATMLLHLLAVAAVRKLLMVLVALKTQEAVAAQLEKIINNLMSNAMKFTPRDGKIDVSFDSGTTNKGEQIITITVADTGKGIRC